MTLVIIFGPPAVGKMTVGLELERHLKIDNTTLAPDFVALRIVKHFGLPLLPASA